MLSIMVIGCENLVCMVLNFSMMEGNYILTLKSILLNKPKFLKYYIYIIPRCIRSPIMLILCKHKMKDIFKRKAQCRTECAETSYWAVLLDCPSSLIRKSYWTSQICFLGSSVVATR